MRRRGNLGLTAAAVAVAALVAGCSSTPADTATDRTCPVGAHRGADGPVEVVMWETFTGEPLRTMQDLVAQYNASQDDVVVRMEGQGVSYAEMQRKFITAIGAGGLPGLIPLEDTQTQFMADSGAIVTAQACAEAAGYDLDRFVPVVRSFYTVDGALQPAASNLSTAVMYLNRDHFTAAGLDPDTPPATLDELRTAAEALKAAGVSDTPMVLVLAPQFVEHWLTGAGVSIVDNNNGRDAVATAATFDNPTTVALYQWLADMSADGLLSAVPGTDGQVDHYFAMALGTASMTVDTSTAISTISAVLEGSVDPGHLGLDLDELPPIDVNVGVAAYPGIDAAGQVQAGGGAFYLPAGNPPEVIAAAWDFMEWFNTAAVQSQWMRGATYMAWNTQAYDEPSVVDWEASTRPGRWLSVAVAEVAALNPGFPGPLIGPYTEVRDAIRRSLDELLVGGATPAEAVASANAAIGAALARYIEQDF